MNEQEFREQLHHAAETRLSGLQGDPWLAQQVMVAHMKGHIGARRKVSAAIVLLVILLIAAVTALAVIFTGHEVILYQDIELTDLVPEQVQQYDVCHKTSFGYVIGGFDLGDDFIAPMSEGMAITCVNDHFQPQWTLEDPRLVGSLFDKVRESPTALYFGTEYHADRWESAIMKVSHSGELLWYFKGPPSLDIEDFMVADTDDVFCAGRQMIDDSVAPVPVIVKLDPDGAICWEKQYSVDGIEKLYSLCMRNNKIIAVGKSEKGAVALELNGEGDIVESFIFETNEPITSMRLKETSEGTLFMVLSMAITNDEADATSKTKYIMLPN